MPKNADRRIDTGPDRRPLEVSPFADLLSPPRTGAIEAPRENRPRMPEYTVAKTRKGGFPVSVERRAGGKVVTIVRNASGDLDVLLAVLKKHCAAGGAVREGAVELQGDHRAKIEAFLGRAGATA